MLPGFRFLFAAIVLSMSILVFGLGAAALLRAAHEQFASNPSWHPVPEAMFAQKSEATGPVLAMLRVESPPAEQKAPDDATAVVPAVAEPTVIAPPPAEPEKIAAPRPEETSPPAIAKPDLPVSENPAQSEVAPAPTDAAADAAKTAAPDTAAQIASTEPVLPLANDAAPVTPEPAASEQVSAPASPVADAAPTEVVATLGGPPVAVETPPLAAKAVSGRPDRSVIKKRLKARRAARRRRIAARAHVAQQAAQQPAAPFTQLYAQPPAAARGH